MSGEELYVLALQAGLQFFIPAAILLRALYFGARGRLPEGVRDIAIAAVIAGAGAIMDGDAGDLGEALIEVMFNALFVFSILFFILIYLLKLPNLGPWVDGFIGGLLAFAGWIGWVYLLNNEWAAWTAPVVAVGGALGFILLRSLIRRLASLRRLAFRMVGLGIIIALIGGGIWFLTQLG